MRVFAFEIFGHTSAEAAERLSTAIAFLIVVGVYVVLVLLVFGVLMATGLGSPPASGSEPFVLPFL